MGLELEVDGRASDIVESVHRYDDSESHIYMKQDGSINGVELVTHPMTLDWSTGFPFGDMVTDIYNNGGRADESCGLHIHVSRNSFTNNRGRHAMTWLMFMYRNESEITDYVARRRSDQWASFRKPRRGELLAKATGRESGDRYVAVNCNNERTYELRFFASTLDETELRASLEFADASVEYTRGLSCHDVARGHALHWSRFCWWLVDQGDRYGHLVALVAEH